MSTTELAAYVAIPMPSNEPFENGSDRARIALYETLDDLCKLSEQLEFQLYDYGTVKPQIELLEDSKHDDHYLKRYFSPKNIEECEFLHFHSSISNLSTSFHGLPEENSFMHHFYLKRIFDLLVIANIARVGSIEVKDSFILQGGIFQEHAKIPAMDAWPLQRAVELSTKLGWPKLHDIDLNAAWKWVNTNISFVDGFDGTATGRALTAFSRLFEGGKLDESVQLLWSMIGIEALYVKGKASIMEQVRERVQHFLGKQDTHKKKIAQMYEFRSRFVHGAVDFPGLYLIGDADPRFEKYSSEQGETVDIAVAILVATLQEIIRRGWKGLTFGTTVGDISTSDS